MKPLLVSSGEPAGIGPDICLELACSKRPVVILGDRFLLEERARQLNKKITFLTYQKDRPLKIAFNHLTVLHSPCNVKVVAGLLNSENSSYVLEILTVAVQRCLTGEFSGLVTAPVHKGIINQAGVSFTGHTEFLAKLCDVETVVMLLTCSQFKVALVTTHIPLSAVANAITETQLEKVLYCLNHSLHHDFAVKEPKIYVAGLNPHAGEGGYLGQEEINVIVPTLAKLRRQGIKVFGPFPADTMFTSRFISDCDTFVAMYHDQGLPVLKHASFGNAVNVTLGLPIIRTSVDHGTALELAGTGKADSGSLLEAVDTALEMVNNRAYDAHS